MLFRGVGRRDGVEREAYLVGVSVFRIGLDLQGRVKLWLNCGAEFVSRASGACREGVCRVKG